MHRRAIVTPSKLSRLGRLKYTLALLAALAISGAVRAHPATGASCVIGYPFKSSDPRTDVDFNESEVLRAFSPQQTVNATPGLTIKVWYNDEHALTLGVRRVIVKTLTGTTTTDYPFSALLQNPGGVLNPQVGTMTLDGDQAGTDTSACSGYPDLCDRPMFPALFITDITTNPSSTAGDWQHGGTPLPPHAVFGTWKGAVRTVNKTKSPAVITVTPDADPPTNSWNLGSGDPAPSGLTNEGWGAEVRWNVDDLVAAGRMLLGHTYRLQFMVHDGDQTGTGGDSGQNCVNIKPYCTDATACDDRNPCTADSCAAGSCSHTPIAGCKLCTTAAGCDDQNACTTDSCDAGVCHNSPIAGCTPCSTVANCNDGNACTTDSCDAGVCHSMPIAGCTPCSTADDCNDGNACTTDSCNGGVCHSTPIAGCTPCSTAGDCNDGNACTTDTCDAGVCHSTAIAGCKLCSTPADCDDQNPCTTDTCDAGGCHNTLIAGCKPCSTPADCDDQNVCTYDSCDGGVCSNTSMDGCIPCTTVADCDDHNPCTYDACDGGICDTTPIEGCTPCTTAADCDDHNACTTDSCVSGICSNTPKNNCRPCSTPSDCNDGNGCTTDTCDSGVCHNTAITGCTPCRTAADCNDFIACTTDSCTGGACVHTNTCPGPDVSSPEICGNCIDDDNNGLTDFEDPACCLQSRTFTMRLKEGRLRPHGATTRLALRSVLARSGLAVNPLEDDVVLQIRPEGGTDVFCAHIPAVNFMKRRRTFEFGDRKHSVVSARGLDGMRIKVMPDGSIRLRTRGKRAQMICPNPGRLQVTVGFRSAAAGDGANRCATTLRTFGARRHGRLRMLSDR